MQTAPTATSHQLDSAASARPATRGDREREPGRDEHLAGRRGAGADEPHRAHPVGVGAAPAVGVVVGVVDRHLQGEGDDERQERGQRAEALRARPPRRCRRERARRPRAGSCGRAPASHWAAVAISSRTASATARRSGLPVCSSGKASRTCSARGAAGAPSRSATQGRRSSRSGAAPGAGTTAATTRCPHSSSGRPKTTASATSGCSRSAASTADGATFTPPLITTSSSRPCTVSRPSSSDPGVAGAEPAVDEGGRGRRRDRGGSPARGSARPARRPSATRTPTPASGTPVVDAAAGGLGHAVGGHHGHALGPRAGEQGGVRGGAADEHGVEGPQRVGLGVEEPAQLGGHERGVAAAGGHAGHRGGQRLAAPRARWRACRRGRSGRGPAGRRSPRPGSSSSQLPGPPSRSWVAAAEARSAAADSSTARPAPVEPEVTTTRSAPGSSGSSGRSAARAASTTAGGPAGSTARGRTPSRAARDVVPGAGRQRPRG